MAISSGPVFDGFGNTRKTRRDRSCNRPYLSPFGSLSEEAKIRCLTGNRGGTSFAPTGFFPHHEHGDGADVKIAGNTAGYLLVLIGAVWALQGLNLLGGSFMTGQYKWLIIGING